MGQADAGKRRFAVLRFTLRFALLFASPSGFSRSHIGRPLSEKISLGMAGD